MRSLLLVGLLSTCQALLLQPTIHARAGGLTMGAAINESIDKENPKVSLSILTATCTALTCLLMHAI